MATNKVSIEVEHKTYFALIFLPVAKYERVGDLSCVTVFGIQVYNRIGNLKSIFSIAWGV